MGEYFTSEEIAMVEHEIIAESEILEWAADNALWYLAGVNEMAKKLIRKITEKEGES